jgi:hypothetical protein
MASAPRSTHTPIPTLVTGGGMIIQAAKMSPNVSDQHLATSSYKVHRPRAHAVVRDDAFLRSLLQSADACIVRPVDSTVLTVPGWFNLVGACTTGRFAGDLFNCYTPPTAVVGGRWRSDDEFRCLCLCKCERDDNDDTSGVGSNRTRPIVHLGASSLSLPLLTMQPYLFHHLTPLAHYLDNVGGHDWSLKLFADHGLGVTSMPLRVAIATGDVGADLWA